MFFQQPHNHEHEYSHYHQYHSGNNKPHPSGPFRHWEVPSHQPGFFGGNQQYYGPPQGPYHQGAPPRRPGAFLMNAFQNPDGQFDFQKAVTTVDQVVKTVNQVSPIVKQVGSLFNQKT